MIIGCPKEIKNQEYRVGLTPANVAEYKEHGHEIYVERGAGVAIGFEDGDYERSGAILTDKKTLFEKAQMIIKVKEPIKEEYHFFKEGQILYTYLHLAADRELTDMLLEKKITAIAYETIKVGNLLPCLVPMSSIAGRLSVIQAAKYSEKTFGGGGILLSGVPGTQNGKVTILGGGGVGFNAAQIAAGIGAEVRVLDIDVNRLAYIDQIFDMRIKTLFSNRGNLLECLKDTDVLIGAVLIPGAKAPKLLKKEDLKFMKKGAVVVDVAIDQGGCFETSHATTHDNPVFEVDGVVHYCVANMPGAVAKTATLALTDTTLPYGLMIANLGAKEACLKNPAILQGLNTYQGKITYQGVSQSFNLPYTPADSLL
ncbi:alanine dehydrogenase [Helicobacter mustelae]|nr:alanine dehydrogenase [Helicobacter mustelae]STP12028.1 alanine dehydrogenase [Helicobacter mustelae]